jgi:hypothetical protein
MIGTFNLMYGAASVANSRKFTAGINHILASVHWWGLVVVLLGLLQLLAAAGALLGNQLLCWVAATSAGTNAIGQVFFIFATGAYLPWFLTVIGVDMAAVYGLCVYGGRQAACALWDDSYRDRDVGVP